MRRMLALLAVTAVAFGISAGPAAAADSGWRGYSFCPYIDGCGMISDLWSTGAASNDSGCPGSVGQKIKFVSNGTTWISGIKYSSTRVAQYHSNTTHFKVYH